MKKYTITLQGCDGYTDIDMELSNEQLELIQKISKLSMEISTIDCEPVLTIEEYEEVEDIPYEPNPIIYTKPKANEKEAVSPNDEVEELLNSWFS